MNGGYSARTLLDKLGYKPGDTVYVVRAPQEFAKYLQFEGIIAVDALPATWAHGFFKTQKDLQSFCDRLDLSQTEKGFWVSWPKKASKVPTDLTEQIFRDIILPTGWVDTKVAAIDETWSGLKFLRRRVPDGTRRRKN